MKQIVFVTTSFEGVHSWPEAPDAVGFLRYPHRHIFHVKVGAYTQGDRSIEFILFKRDLELFLAAYTEYGIGHRSCEAMCTAIHDRIVAMGLSPAFIEVNEDDENGVILTYEE